MNFMGLKDGLLMSSFIHLHLHADEGRNLVIHSHLLMPSTTRLSGLDMCC
jgi:hypothetical protein